MSNTTKKVVVMGGGTGTFPVISGLKHLNVALSCIIAVSDDGGSTGRIRDEFGFQPVGDLRQSLAALAEAEGEQAIRELLLYRFAKGEGLKGHNLGNILLTALQDITGDTTAALQLAAKIFRLDGEVLPVTQDNVNLQIVYQDGSTAVGEHILDESVSQPRKIARVELVPSAQLNPAAAQAIQEADIVIIGPGDYYASLMATLIPTGIPQVFRETQAKVVYIVNLMTRLTQTHEMTAAQHVAGIEAAIGRPLDHLLMNDQPIPSEILEAYASEGEFPVKDDLASDLRLLRAPLLSEMRFQKLANDTAHRSLLRHDKRKLAHALETFLW